MENQTKVDNNPQTGQNLENNNIQLRKNKKTNYRLFLSIALLFILLIYFLRLNILKNKQIEIDNFNDQFFSEISKTPTIPVGQNPTVIPVEIKETTPANWRKAKIINKPGLAWTFRYPNGWHIVFYQSKVDTNYPTIVEINTEPISLDPIRIETRDIITVTLYDQLVNPEEEMQKMMEESKKKIKNIKEESFLVGKNTIYRIQGESDSQKTQVLEYYTLLSETVNEKIAEKAVIKAELGAWWPIEVNNPNQEKEYVETLDYLVKSLSSEKFNVPGP